MKGWKTIALVALVLVSCVLLWQIKAVLSPFLVGLLLAYLGDPVVDRIETLGVSRSLSVTIVFVVMFLLLVTLSLILIPMLIQQGVNFVSRLPEWLHWLQSSLLPLLKDYFNLSLPEIDPTQLKGMVTDNWRQASNVLLQLYQRLSGSGAALAMLLANLFLIPVVTFYLLRDWDVMVARLRESLPRSVEPVVSQLARGCDEVLSAFLRGQLMVMASLAVIYSIGLAVVGLDLALLLGAVAGLASVVPYMGFVVGIVVASIAAYIQFHEFLPLLYVAAVFGVGQLLEGMLLTPLLVGDKIGLHPVAVIFAVMAGGELAGFVGVLLALPVAAVIMVLLRFAHDQYRSSEFYRAGHNAPGAQDE